MKSPIILKGEGFDWEDAKQHMKNAVDENGEVNWMAASFADPGVTESSDYVSSFYVAGRLAPSGEFDRPYPEPSAVSFRGTRFNDSAHQLPPRLPERTTTNFMYPPIVAWIFAH